jgi:hypothetical protein
MPAKPARDPNKLTRKEKRAINIQKNQQKNAAQLAHERSFLHPEPEVLRPHTEADIEAVIDAISNGETARNTCRKLGVRCGKLLMEITSNDQMMNRYMRARQMQAHHLVEQSVEDLEGLDNLDPAADGASVAVSVVKLKSDVRRWTAGKYHISAYGDRVTNVHEGNPEKPIETVSTALTKEEAAERYQQRLARERELANKK